MAALESSTTKQRRGKTDSSASANNGTSAATLMDQIAIATNKMETSKQQTRILHQQWRTYLLRLSYLLILVSMHQMQGPTAACLKDIKAWNAISADDNEKFSGAQAMVLVLSDAATYILAIVVAAALSFLLILEEPAGFSHPRYLLANALVPPLVGMYYMNKDKESCLDPERVARIEPEPCQRSLPVVVVFHVVVTACYWFMEKQRNQIDQNMRMVEKFEQDIVKHRKETAAAESKTATGGGGSKTKKKN